MLTIFRRVISLIILSMALYGLFTDHFELLPYTILLLGVLMSVMGLEEFKKDRKSYSGYGLFFLSFLILLVSIKGLLS
ncbi:hypothetical protein [Mesobacillus subterraneus]|uniref:DUF3953 domain-containing protein n=1 Tax=Mesobacillus subterraneus TaxID=285983 RepID=A0A3R9EBY9_9BACI|nr:hypothetical protein [Mesobacillus subterraneus]RSD28420.1 hypothetical protein EJA10_04865 [Mesobacillus subterraneus]